MSDSPEPAELRTSLRAASARPFVVAARWLLLAVAAAAGVGAWALALRDPIGDVTGARYGCPMHADVRSGKPGQCPICGMALEPTARGVSANAMREGSMPGMPDLAAVENVRKHKVLDFVRMHALPIEVRELPTAISNTRCSNLELR